MELALDGTIAAFAKFGDEIDPGIVTRKVRLPIRPLVPQPDVGELIDVHRILAEVPPHEAFEEPPLLRRRLGMGTDMIERPLKAAVHGDCHLNVGVLNVSA